MASLHVAPVIRSSPLTESSGAALAAQGPSNSLKCRAAAADLLLRSPGHRGGAGSVGRGAGSVGQGGAWEDLSLLKSSWHLNDICHANLCTSTKKRLKLRIIMENKQYVSHYG